MKMMSYIYIPYTNCFQFCEFRSSAPGAPAASPRLRTARRQVLRGVVTNTVRTAPRRHGQAIDLAVERWVINSTWKEMLQIQTSNLYTICIYIYIYIYVYLYIEIYYINITNK